MTGSDNRSIRTLVNALVVIGLAASLAGCAGIGFRPVEVSDLATVAGTWQGVVYEPGPGSESRRVQLTIREDGTYDIVSRQSIGESRGTGTVTVSGGRVILEGKRGRGVGTLLKTAAGEAMLTIDATLADNSTLTAQLTRRSS